MNRLLITLLLTLLMALVAESRYLAHLEGERTALQRANALLSAGVEQREETIGQLQAEQGRQAEAERALRQSLLRAGELTMNQQLNDQRVIHSDETLQNWSDAALPDGIIRLQQHPAFASPDDYLAWLSRRQQLQDTGKPAANSGGSADRDPPAGAGAADVRPASRNH